MVVQWLPSHIGIEQQDAVDVLAKIAASRCVGQAPCSRSVVRAVLQEKAKGQWNDLWAKSSTGRKLFDLGLTSPLKHDAFWELNNRLHRRIITRLRQNHSLLTQREHWNGGSEEKCPKCYIRFGLHNPVEHILAVCPALTSIRRRYLREAIWDARRRAAAKKTT